MQKVLFCSESFAYGPVSNLVSIARLFKTSKRVFCGEQTAYDYASRNRFAFEELCETTVVKTPCVLDGIDLAVIVMDPQAALAAARRSIPILYFDALHWFWPFDVDEASTSARIQAERFLNEDLPIDTLAGFDRHFQIKMAYWWANAICIQGKSTNTGPIVDVYGNKVRPVQAIVDVPQSKPRVRRGNSVFVSVGGTLTPQTSLVLAEQYLVLLDALFRAHTPKRYETKWAGHPFAVDVLNRLGNNAQSLDRPEFHIQIQRASFALTPMGITTIYEAAAQGIPLGLLPQTSTSHRTTLDYLHRQGGVEAWPATLLPLLHEDHCSFDVFENSHRELLNDWSGESAASLQKAFRSTMERLSDPLRALEAATCQQDAVIRIVGGFEGAQDIADLAESM